MNSWLVKGVEVPLYPTVYIFLGQWKQTDSDWSCILQNYFLMTYASLSMSFGTLFNNSKAKSELFCHLLLWGNDCCLLNGKKCWKNYLNQVHISQHITIIFLSLGSIFIKNQSWLKMNRNPFKLGSAENKRGVGLYHPQI